MTYRGVRFVAKRRTIGHEPIDRETDSGPEDTGDLSDAREAAHPAFPPRRHRLVRDLTAGWRVLGLIRFAGAILLVIYGLTYRGTPGYSLPSYVRPLDAAVAALIGASAIWQLSRSSISQVTLRRIVAIDVLATLGILELFAGDSGMYAFAILVPVQVAATFVLGAPGGLGVWALSTGVFALKETVAEARLGEGHYPAEMLVPLATFFVVVVTATLSRRLREENELWSALIRSAPESILLVGGSGEILLANRRAVEVLGYTEKELVGASVELLVPESLRERHAGHRTDWLEKPRARPLDAHIDLRCRRKDGSEFPSEIMLSPVRRGNLSTTLVTIVDITERRRAEKMLRDAEERYRTLVERIPAIVYIAEFGYPAPWLYVSPQAESILGYPPEEWIADEGLWMRLIHPDDLERVQGEERRSQETGEPFACEYRMRARDDRIVWVRDEAEVVPGDPGLLRGLMYDITARKTAEEELARNLEQLRRTDQARRLLLSKLVTAQEAERGRIAADLHDDSIQVMTAVGIRLHSLTGKDAKEQAEALAKLEGIVNTAIARLRGMLFELQPRGLETGSLADALREYLGFSADEDAATTVDIVDRLARKLPTKVRFIGYRIAQEALNNARKHADATQIAVLLEERENGLFVRIRDDGVGFDSAIGSPAGHLGLTSMGERANLAGGWMRVNSRLGAGTVVEFWIPFAAQFDTPTSSSIASLAQN
jgi:PAS domain S-box-containing protein